MRGKLGETLTQYRGKLVKRDTEGQYEGMSILPGDDDFKEEEPWAEGESGEGWDFEESDTEEIPGNEVVAVNEEFYRALESLEIERMDKVWHHADWITCVHPGGPMLTGWDNVRDSWVQIFKGTQDIRFELSDTSVRIENRTAWVTCTENILHLSTSGVSNVAATATNIFLQTNDGWRIVLHHASPVPETENKD